MGSQGLSRIRGLIDEITLASKQAGDDFKDHKELRMKALSAARKLIVALENPEEAIHNVAFLPVQSLCARIAVDLDIFDIIGENRDSPVTIEEVASKCNTEKLLIVRIMRVLAAIKFVDEVAVGAYIANPITRAMMTPQFKACIKFFYDQALPVHVKLPDYLKEHNYICPTDPVNGPFQYAMNTRMETFQYWTTQPGAIENFSILMTGSKGSKRSWATWFPVEERILRTSELDDASVLLVDIAGGFGTEITAFQKIFPDSKGRLILQDLPKVIDQVNGQDPRIELMAYNFFTPQPVKGAQIYYFHFVFHDWTDESCIEILKNTILAMGPSSRILLNETILPDISCSLHDSIMDINMMALHSGLERSEKQWLDLLHAAGLEVVKFWHNPGEGEGVIEAVPMKPNLINGV